MKKQFNYLVLLFQCFILITTLCSFAQQPITHTVTKENKSGNGDGTELDITAIKGDPKALLFVAPLNDKEWSNNPHPVMAFYFKGKWNIVNRDNATMPIGAKFNVSYFIKSDAEHFQYLVTRESLQKDGTAFIDHPSLNNDSSAQFTIFHSWAPESKEYANREEIKTQYNVQEGKWVVSNINNQPLITNIAYNINISSGSKSPTVPVSNTPANTNTTNANPATTNPTNTVAAGNSITGPIIEMYMTVWAGPTKLPGESFKIAHLDQVELAEFEFGVSSPRDLATGQIGGKKQYEPIIIKKFAGGFATIPYFNALVKNQELIITIDFYSTSISNPTSGAQGLNYTVKLTGARFSSFHQAFEESTSNHARGYLDVVKITFAKIEFIKDGISVADF